MFAAVLSLTAIILFATSCAVNWVPTGWYCRTPDPPATISRPMVSVSSKRILPASTSWKKAIRIGILIVLAAGKAEEAFRST